MVRKNPKSDAHRGMHTTSTSGKVVSGVENTKGTKRKGPPGSEKMRGYPTKRSKTNDGEERKDENKARRSIKGQQNKSVQHENPPDTISQPTEQLAFNKRLREDESEEISNRPEKRTRINGNAGLDHQNAPETVTTDGDTFDLTATASSVQAAALEIPEPGVHSDVQHLAQKYNFSTMSIISSSKIESRVRKLLQHVSHFSFVDTKNKPGVVILHAKASVAGKMCSIVEIAKKAVIEEKGKWWQYSKLHGELMDLKPKPVKRSGGGKTLSEWSGEQAENRNGNAIGAGGEEDLPMDHLKDGHDSEDDEMDEAFEHMAKAGTQGLEIMPPEHGGNKVRNTPIMTIYFARVPVPGLKELYG